jgi:hypothetical protein
VRARGYEDCRAVCSKAVTTDVRAFGGAMSRASGMRSDVVRVVMMRQAHGLKEGRKGRGIFCARARLGMNAGLHLRQQKFTCKPQDIKDSTLLHHMTNTTNTALCRLQSQVEHGSNSGKLIMETHPASYIYTH